MKISELIVDGVRYAPVIESSPDAETLMGALALTYITPAMLEEPGAERWYRNLYVTVGEEHDEYDMTIEQFVGALMTGQAEAEDEITLSVEGYADILAMNEAASRRRLTEED